MNPEPKEETLLPCPFCGETGTGIVKDGITFWARCAGCHMRSEALYQRDVVVELWNTRPDSQLAEDRAEAERLKIALRNAYHRMSIDSAELNRDWDTFEMKIVKQALEASDKGEGNE